MDFSVQKLCLTFLQSEVLTEYLIFYFDKTWDEYKKTIFVGLDKNNMTPIETNTNYIKLPYALQNSKYVIVKVVGKSNLDTIETNYEIGRRE